MRKEVFDHRAVFKADTQGGRKSMNIKDRTLHLGDRIKCKNWKDLKKTAFALASEGYGVTVIGFSDMSEDILTIIALPEGGDQ